MELFRRKAFYKLQQWKASKNRKPLIVRGARQVGKSTLIKQFSKEYDNYLEINLEKEKFKKIFEDNDQVKRILEILSLELEIPYQENNTLIFLDEIQECPAAIQMLRYFREEIPELHVIAAGSLLEFAMSEVKSFPVGRVDYLMLHPFDFEEFLTAMDNTPAVEVLNKIPFENHYFQTILNKFHVYAVIGGMPEIIQKYAEERSNVNLLNVYNSIWEGYRRDIEKYGKNSSEKNILRHIFLTAPHETDRISFAGFGNSNYRSREIGESFRALDMAKVIRLLYPSTQVKPPLTLDYKKRPRLQFLDTGLLNHTLEIQSDLLSTRDLNDIYKGKIIQHLVTQELIACFDKPDFTPAFWVSEKSYSSAEVDLVVQQNMKLIPIEVKSGPQGKLRSLHQFVEKTNHKYAIRLLSNKFSVQEVKTPGGTPYLLMNLPYFLGVKFAEYINWFLKNY